MRNIEPIRKVRPGPKCRYEEQPRMAALEEREYLIERVDESIPKEVGYLQHVKEVMEERWMNVSERTTRAMHGFYILESHTQGLQGVRDANKRIRCVKLSIWLQQIWNIMGSEYTQKHINRIIKGLIGRWRAEVKWKNTQSKEKLARKTHQINNRNWIRVAAGMRSGKLDPIWLKHTAEHPWARSVPLIISLARYSCIEYLAEGLDRPNHSTTQTLSENDGLWKQWGSDLAQ